MKQRKAHLFSQHWHCLISLALPTIPEFSFGLGVVKNSEENQRSRMGRIKKKNNHIITPESGNFGKKIFEFHKEITDYSFCTIEIQSEHPFWKVSLSSIIPLLDFFLTQGEDNVLYAH